MNEDLDSLAEEIYDAALSARRDNKSGNPRDLGCEYKELMDGPKHFYRSIAQWHLKKLNPGLVE